MDGLYNLILGPDTLHPVVLTVQQTAQRNLIDRENEKKKKKKNFCLLNKKFWCCLSSFVLFGFSPQVNEIWAALRNY